VKKIEKLSFSSSTKRKLPFGPPAVAPLRVYVLEDAAVGAVRVTLTNRLDVHRVSAPGRRCARSRLETVFPRNVFATVGKAHPEGDGWILYYEYKAADVYDDMVPLLVPLGVATQVPENQFRREVKSATAYRQRCEAEGEGLLSPGDVRDATADLMSFYGGRGGHGSSRKKSKRGDKVLDMLYVTQMNSAASKSKRIQEGASLGANDDQEEDE
jgi:hypothetical protein